MQAGEAVLVPGGGGGEFGFVGAPDDEVQVANPAPPEQPQERKDLSRLMYIFEQYPIPTGVESIELHVPFFQ